MPTTSKKIPNIINLTLEAATAKAIKQGFVIRPTIVDGKPLVGSCDIQENRLNVSVNDGIVTAVSQVG